MASLFSKPKVPDTTKVPPPAAIPELAPEAGEDAARRARKRSGFRSTIMTGALAPSDTGKKKLLGG